MRDTSPRPPDDPGERLARKLLGGVGIGAAVIFGLAFVSSFFDSSPTGDDDSGVDSGYTSGGTDRFNAQAVCEEWAQERIGVRVDGETSNITNDDIYTVQLYDASGARVGTCVAEAVAEYEWRLVKISGP